MSVKSFKFVSPGVFVNEVDNSQLPRLPEDMGPVIIGRAERGPAMVPVKIDSFSEFVETFGEPIAGAQADDAWRQGNRLGPTYGAFAAQAYLRNGSPITFVRLLGESSQNDGTAFASGGAGWSMPAAYGLYVSSDVAFTDDTNVRLAGVVYSAVDGATPTAASVTGEKITLHVPVSGTGTPGTYASQVLTVNDFSDAQNDTLTVAKDLASTFSVAFDNTINSSSFAAGTLTIGTVDLTTVEELAAAIAAEVNNLATAFKVTASASGDEVTFVMDIVGATAGDVVAEAPADDGFSTAVLVAGTAAVGASPVEKTFVVNFDRNSKNYIRKILNTNPTLTNDTITETAEGYFLGATFDQFIEDEAFTIQSAKLVEIGGSDHNSFLASAKKAQTPWIRSQYTGDYASMTANLAPGDLAKLFKFECLSVGAWEQKNFKISIVDVKAPPSGLKYGSFSVVLRDAKDHDARPVVYERFSNVNLDPTSSRYIAAVIGDMDMVWSDTEKRYTTTGDYPNQSRFIRVVMHPDVASGAANPELLPFAFEAPTHADATASGVSTPVEPTFFLRDTTDGDSKLPSAKEACFGVSTARPDALGLFDDSYQDIVTPLYGSEDMLGTSRNGALFSLDLLVETNSIVTYDASPTGNDALRDRASVNGKVANASGFSAVLSAGYDKFTVPLVGGLDGLNITEIDPFCERVIGDESASTSSAYYSVSKAIDTVADPEVVECNLMAMPGIATPGLTGKLISTCESRADALAIIDLEGDYQPRGTTSENAVEPNVDTAISELDGRGLNSSYGCAFFPWVQINDQINNRLVWMPPSVAALGTMASSAAKSELWFAPAGFTRGGLSNGSAGLPVVQTKLRLSSKERDKLYEANINPIAQFPAEGIVIFGQKTLQVTPSALDRINVRRLMVHVKKEISRMAATVLFDQNVEATWLRFLSRAEPFLAGVKARFGLTEYRIILDETTTTPELVDRNIMYAKIYLKPARAIEFIALDFVITNTGASFDD